LSKAAAAFAPSSFPFFWPREILTEKLKAYAILADLVEMTFRMKLIAALAVFITLMIAVPAVLGEMTDYQRGVANGLKIGLFMGEYYGKGQYVTESAGQFNTYLENYNQFLWTSFADNQTLINEFMLSPIAVWTRSSSTGVLIPDASGRVLGYPADSYFTWIGAVPGTTPLNPGDALPGV